MRPKPIKLYRILPLAIALSLIITAVNLTASSSSASLRSAPEQKDKNKDKDGHKGKKGKKDNNSKTTAAPVEIGKPALRTDREDISKLDLNLGIGSEEGMPKPPFQFKGEDTTGTN